MAAKKKEMKKEMPKEEKKDGKSKKSMPMMKGCKK